LNTTEQLRNYGIASSNIRALGSSASPELLDYLDLVEPRRELTITPDGVAENLGRPLLFFVNESKLATDPAKQEAELNQLRRSLACRGERTYLARILPGELKVVPASLADQTPNWQIYQAGTSEAITFFSRLALGNYDGLGEPRNTDFVFDKMFELLSQSAEVLAGVLNKADVLSLIGRALFFRFLSDRQIVIPDNKAAIAPEASEIYASFDTPRNAAATCSWLDRTFNGDFLPLSGSGDVEFFKRAELVTDGALFTHLGAIVRAAQYVGAGYQLSLPWAAFDFAHIPVGLLSQVYEAFCRKWDPTSRETSVHYTPRNIAATLVSEAFDGLADAHRAKILDPACGAGVFLVIAFRWLYRQRWMKEGKRPNTKAIRNILETQLVGFDISDYALRLAALSLYLTAIELDPHPLPPESLRFNEVRNKVLFNHRRPDVDPETGPVIGSLGTHLGNQFEREFDLVIGNPPWKSLEEKYKPLAEEFTAVSRSVIDRMGDGEAAIKYQNPDNAPDLPFLWKSTEWCKPNGRIAMALPARILLKQEQVPQVARETLFRLVEITGIINGSNLADTRVWPNMNQPFMLLFAINRRSKVDHVLRFVTSHYDAALNRRGEVRIDSKSSQSIEMSSTFDEPWLWKALTVGTALDVEVIRKVKSASPDAKNIDWKNGYQIAAKQEKRPQQDASFLHGLPNLDSTDLFRFVVNAEELDSFSRETLLYPRKREIYRAPLVLVNATPGEHRERGRALLAFSDVVYNESFNGYSAADRDDGNLAVRYLHLFVHSNLWAHYSLMVSAEFGAERRKFQKGDLSDCPIIPTEALSEDQQKTVIRLSMRLEKFENKSADQTIFREIDLFFGELYGLDQLDLDVIDDTLSVESPFQDARRNACRSPTPSEREAFRRRLESVIRPFFRVLGKEPRVTVWKPVERVLRDKAPFGIAFISHKDGVTSEPETLFEETILDLAENTGSTRIIQEMNLGLVVGILNQYRYWTPSRARLLGAEIVGQHMGPFEN
jgi:hypothetical protein